MKSHRTSGRSRQHRIKIQKPTIQDHEDEKVWKRIHQFSDLIPQEPDPFQGRLGEIKDEIRRGIYLNRDVIEETAARLAARFMKAD